MCNHLLVLGPDPGFRQPCVNVKNIDYIFVSGTCFGQIGGKNLELSVPRWMVQIDEMS